MSTINENLIALSIELSENSEFALFLSGLFHSSQSRLKSHERLLDFPMAKQKNTSNKKLHSKLMGQKKNKKQLQKEANKLRIREMNQRANQGETDTKSE